jgi:hypothetical protein
MKTILIESQYIGCCRYWNLLLQADSIVLDKHEHYVKRSYRNRAHILGANGLLRLSVPLESGKHQHAAMKDVRISYKENWQKIHWQSITAAYRRSPFFEYYEDHFIQFYETEEPFLVDFNLKYLQQIAAILKVELPVVFSEKYNLQSEVKDTDFRNYCMPQHTVATDFPTYPQVFSDRFAFQPDLCVLDVLFNLGNRSVDYLKTIKS